MLDLAGFCSFWDTCFAKQEISFDLKNNLPPNVTVFTVGFKSSVVTSGCHLLLLVSIAQSLAHRAEDQEVSSSSPTHPRLTSQSCYHVISTGE